VSLLISTDRMTSDVTGHQAIRVTGPCQPERWRVSRLPERRMSRNEAVTAMTLAETLATPSEPDPHGRTAAVLAVLAGELDMTTTQVINRVSQERTR
jgi:hypothetical protein